MKLADVKSNTQIINLTTVPSGKKIPLTIDTNKAYLFNSKVTATVCFNYTTNRHYYSIRTDYKGRTLFSKSSQTGRFNKGVPLTCYLFKSKVKRSRQVADNDYTSSSYPNLLTSMGTVHYYTEDEVLAELESTQEKTLLENLIGDAVSIVDTDTSVDVQPPVEDSPASQIDLDLTDSNPEDSSSVEATVTIKGVELTVSDARKLLGI